jgi:hypothetical protein
VTAAVRRALAGAAVPVGYLLLALGASWPLARDFATYTVGDVHYDERHAIWVLWYTARALAGQVTWPDTTDVLWPHGISVLVDGVGPLNGLLALPFWPWGPAAAFNGVALAGLALSGWCLYALARGVGVPRGPAWVAGALYLLWPIHLIALTGHLEKLFIGMLPLTLLAGLRAFEPARHRAWLIAPGLCLLGALLQNGNQFVFGALGVGVLGAQTWWAAAPADRAPRLRRMLIAGALSVAICAPLLWAIVQVMRDPTLAVALGEQTRYYSPDALSLLLPSPFQRAGAWLFPGDMHLRNYVWTATLPGLNPTPDWYGTGLETAVTIPISALVLGALAWRDRDARRWLIFGAIFGVLCLGPRLRIAGVATGIPLPYDALQQVPGLDVMRTPGRFMLLASVGFALAAGLGLAALARRRSGSAAAIVAIAGVVAVGECWPKVWAQTALPHVPPFYARLAADPTPGAVLDLPHGWYNRSDRASAYMYYQLTHRKPIAWSYLSRYHVAFPNPGLDGLWQRGVPAGPDVRARLAGYGFRYVVFHKYSGMFVGGRVETGMLAQPWGPPTPREQEPLLRDAFAGEPPIYEDALVMVWPLDPGLNPGLSGRPVPPEPLASPGAAP